MPRLLKILPILFLSGSFAMAKDPIRLALLPDTNLGFKDSPVVSYLETQLSASPEVRLVERAEIDRVWEEIAFQQTFSANEGGARRGIGGLLQADLLVLLSARQEGDLRSIRLVVSRTSDGVRLITDRFFWDEAASDSTADRLLEAIQRGISKSQVDQPALIAVLPFRNQDLSRTYDSLSPVYTEVAQRVFSSQPEVVLVEVEEAQSLAQERELASDSAAQSRPVPFILEGAYTSEGRGLERKVRFSLTLGRAGEEIHSATLESLPPEAAANALEKAAGEMIEKISGQKSIPLDPDAQAQELVRRAKEYEIAADYLEAMALYEAALFVQPKLTPIHRKAFTMAIELVAEFFDGKRTTSDKIQSGRTGFEYALRALDHVEKLIYTIYPGELYDLFVQNLANSVDNRVDRLLYSYWPGIAPLELLELAREYQGRKEEIYVTFLESLQLRGLLTEPVMRALNSPLSNFGGFVQPEYHDPYHNDRKLRLLRVVASTSRPVTDIYDSIWGIHRKKEKSPEEEAFLKEVSDLTQEAVQLAIRSAELLNKDEETEAFLADLRDLQEAYKPYGQITNLSGQLKRKIQDLEKKLAENPPEPAPSEIAGGASGDFPAEMKPAEIFRFHKKPVEVVFHELANLLPEDAIMLGFNAVDLQFGSWLATDLGYDLISAYKGIYLLRKGERLARFGSIGRDEYFGDIVQDNDSIWIPVLGDRQHIVVLDKQSFESTTFAEEDGIPPIGKQIQIAPLGNGKAFVVGSFGRTWAGYLNLAPDGTKSVEILFEAKNTHGHPDNVETAFQPRFLKVQTSPDGKHESVSVGRLMEPRPGDNIMRRGIKNLRIDLETGEASLVNPDPSEDPFNNPNLSPEERNRAIAEHMEDSATLKFSYDGVFYGIREDKVFRYSSENGKKIQTELTAWVPFSRGYSQNRQVFVSSIYGPVYILGGKIYRIEFPRESGS
jgi:hypothetical protein